jgi:hypothetical protein
MSIRSTRNYDYSDQVDVALEKPNELVNAKTIIGLIKNAPLVNVRKEPSKVSESIMVLRLNETFEMLDSGKPFTKIRLKDGRIGYVFSEFCSEV